jgi:hypothetical protein
MTKVEELLSHAARCNRLAEVCLDRAVAEKLRQLAQNYRELAGQPPGDFPRVSPRGLSPKPPQRVLDS